MNRKGPKPAVDMRASGEILNINGCKMCNRITCARCGDRDIQCRFWAGLQSSSESELQVGRNFPGRVRFRTCIKNVFITLKVTIVFLLWRRFIVLHRGSFCEWSDCDFSSANSICKHSCVLLFPVWIRVTHFLRRDSGEEISKRLRRKDQSLTRILACFFRSL